jgi:hypothetical protein
MSMERNIEHRRLSKHGCIFTCDAHILTHYGVVMNFPLLHSHRSGCLVMISDGTTGDILKWGLATPLKLTLYSSILLEFGRDATRRASSIRADINDKLVQHFIKQSSVAQLASASDCYTSGYQEVGSSSLPGGGLLFLRIE